MPFSSVISRSLSASLLCAIALAPQAARASHSVGNPGDPLRIQIEEAREDTRVIFIRVPPDALVVGTSAARDYYRDHYEEFGDALRRAEFVFEEDAAPACALAVRQESRIYFSYPTCRSVTSKADAIKLLIHETTHLIGNEDETIADQVALAIYNSWTSLDASRTPRWDSMNPNGAPSERSAHAWASFRDVDGHDKLFVWGGCNESDDIPLACSTFLSDGGIYDLTSQTWEAVAPTPAGLAADVGKGRAFARAVFTGRDGPDARRILISGGCTGTAHLCDSTFASVLEYDLVARTWRAFPGAFGQKGRVKHHAFWTGRALLIWGGVADPTGVGLGRSLVDGWLLDQATPIPQWTRLADSPTLSSRRHTTAVLTGSDADPAHRQLIVFGGCDRQVGAYCPRYLNDGAILSFDAVTTGTWRPINAAALSGRAWHAAVWTGTQMIVWGGQNRGPLRDGGIFTPGTTAADDTWLLIAGNDDAGRWEHNAVWTGDRMLVWGGQARLGEPASKVLEFYLPTSATRFGRWNVPMTAGSPVGRWLNTAAWTGYGLVVWGGLSQDRSYLNSGGIFLPKMEP